MTNKEKLIFENALRRKHDICTLSVVMDGGEARTIFKGTRDQCKQEKSRNRFFFAKQGRRLIINY